jgi:hypothetical protein
MRGQNHAGKDAENITLEAYLLHHNVSDQFPRTRWRVYKWWLLDFCAELDLSVVRVPAHDNTHGETNAYPLQALQALQRSIAKNPQWPRQA